MTQDLYDSSEPLVLPVMSGYLHHNTYACVNRPPGAGSLPDARQVAAGTTVGPKIIPAPPGYAWIARFGCVVYEAPLHPDVAKSYELVLIVPDEKVEGRAVDEALFGRTDEELAAWREYLEECEADGDTDPMRTYSHLRCDMADRLGRIEKEQGIAGTDSKERPAKLLEAFKRRLWPERYVTVGQQVAALALRSADGRDDATGPQVAVPMVAMGDVYADVEPGEEGHPLNRLLGTVRINGWGFHVEAIAVEPSHFEEIYCAVDRSYEADLSRALTRWGGACQPMKLGHLTGDREYIVFIYPFGR